AQYRLGAHLGALLLLSEAVLHGARQSALEARSPDALRPRGVGFSLQPCRTSRPARPAGSGLPEDPSNRRLALVGPADSAVGQIAARDRRVRAFGLGSSSTGSRVAQLRDAAVR